MHDDYVVQKILPTPTEAEALLAIERATLGDSPYEAAHILELLQRPEHHAYLATLEGAPVGFCSCLETPTRDGPQLELDMLGVLTAHRGRGVATRLIRRATEDALRRGVERFRAVVREDNIASRRVFERVGLSPSACAYDMLVYEIRGYAPLAFLPRGWTWSFVPLAPGLEMHELRDAAGARVAVAECLQVYTLAYAGLWLEQLWASSERSQALAGRALVERAKALSLDEVGYLLPQTEARYSDALLREGYRYAGRYIILTAGRA